MIVLTFVYVVLRNGDVLMRVLGTSIMRIIQRLMGLILLVIAVQFVINGTISVIKPLLWLIYFNNSIFFMAVFEPALIWKK